MTIDQQIIDLAGSMGAIGLAPFIKKWGKKEEWMVKSVRQLVEAIENKDAVYLRMVVGNTDNKASREAFYLITKIKLPKTMSGSKLSVDSFCGISEEARVEMIRRHEKKIQDERKRSELVFSFRNIALIFFGNDIKKALAKWKELNMAFCKIERLGNLYALIDATNENLYIAERRTKHGLAKAWNDFLRACLYFGGLDQSLKIIEDKL